VSSRSDALGSTARIPLFCKRTQGPFQSPGEVTKAAWAADLAMLAYARNGENRITDADFGANFRRAGLAYEKIGGSIADWNAPGTQAIFASGANLAIRAFRGTERDDPDDLVSDADTLLVPESDYLPVSQDPGPPLGHLSSSATYSPSHALCTAVFRWR
jgi:hypothetical protein